MRLIILDNFFNKIKILIEIINSSTIIELFMDLAHVLFISKDIDGDLNTILLFK